MKKLILSLLLLSAAAFPQAGTLAGVSVGENPDLHGWTIASPYSVDVSGMAVDSYVSPGFIADASAMHIHMDFAGSLYYGSGIPISVVDSTTGTPALVPVPQLASYASDGDATLWPVPATYIQEGGNGGGVPDCDQAAAYATYAHGDSHLLILDKGTGWLYESYIWNRCHGQYTSDLSAIFDATTSNRVQQRPLGATSSDGGGFSLFAGLAKYDETTTGVCHDHLADGTALDTMCHGSRFTMDHIRCSGYLNGDGVSGFFAPASHASCYNGGGWNIYGIRLRLKESYDTSGLTGSALIIANSWKKYGLVLADGGSNLYVSGTMDARWDTNNLLTLQAITGANFDVVTTGTLYLPSTAIPSSGVPAVSAVALLPTGTAPTNHTPTVSASTVIQGQPVTFTWTASTNVAYEYLQNGVPGRSGTATFTPQNSACYPLVSKNLYGVATSAPVCVTVLVPPLVGAGLIGKR